MGPGEAPNAGCCSLNSNSNGAPAPAPLEATAAAGDGMLSWRASCGGLNSDDDVAGAAAFGLAWKMFDDCDCDVCPDG